MCVGELVRGFISDALCSFSLIMNDIIVIRYYLRQFCSSSVFVQSTKKLQTRLFKRTRPSVHTKDSEEETKQKQTTLVIVVTHVNGLSAISIITR